MRSRWAVAIPAKISALKALTRYAADPDARAKSKKDLTAFVTRFKEHKDAKIRSLVIGEILTSRAAQVRTMKKAEKEKFIDEIVKYLKADR